jgi:hypothetical protein
MLRASHDEVEKHYYDPKFQGIDLDARYHVYDGKLVECWHGVGCRVFQELKDSHTYFVPPMRPYSFDAGFRVEMIGDGCFITRVRPKTDAADKLHPGERIVTLNSYPVTRRDMETLLYYFTFSTRPPALI